MDHRLIENLTSWLPRALRQVGEWIWWISPLFIVGLIWEAVTRLGLVNTTVLPSLTAIIRASFDLTQSSRIFYHLAISFYRALAGLMLGACSGVTLGILMARSHLMRELLEPLVVLTFPLPKAAFIPIALLWLGVGNASSILVVALSTLLPMVVSTYEGARGVHGHLIWSAQAMGASPFRTITSIIVPASLPHIVNGLRIGLAFSVVVVISAEMVAARTGIGKFILLFGESGNYHYMFAAIFITASATFISDRCFSLVKRRLLQWTDGEGGRR